MEVTLKPDLQTRSCNNTIIVNYRSQKFMDLLGPTQYASVTRLSPAFRVRVWLRETTLAPSLGLWAQPTLAKTRLKRAKRACFALGVWRAQKM